MSAQLELAGEKEFPVWKKDNIDSSLDAVYQWTAKKANERIAWYDRKKSPRRFWSQSLRATSIIFAAVGALCPLIDATKVPENLMIFPGAAQGSLILAQWGYVFLAVAASVAGFDYYFGHSSGWMRFMVTQISIERALREFQYDWMILKAQQEKVPTNASIFLQRAKDFSLQIENLVKQETDAWVAEFQTNITQLEKVLKTEIEARKSGSIKVAVKNCADFDQVEILLNDSPVKTLQGISEGIINAVAPGRYEIAVIGRKNGKESRASKVVEVQPGAMAAADFMLN